MQPIGYLAHLAAETTLFRADPQAIQLLEATGAALLVLLVETILSVYKPRGMTQYGWRKQNEQRKVSPMQSWMGKKATDLWLCRQNPI